VLDIGCGWGGLVIHAVKNYGVQAHGITRSEQRLPSPSIQNHRWGERTAADPGRLVSGWRAFQFAGRITSGVSKKWGEGQSRSASTRSINDSYSLYSSLMHVFLPTRSAGSWR
jgi:hypothetical protein